MKPELILVTGATGAQGGAVARHLLAAGRRVRILTRNPACAAALALIAAGAEAVRGDFDDAISLRAAMTGINGVFSMQNAVAEEVAQGLALVEEARRAGVQQFVHTSVSGTTGFEQFPDWGTGRWTESYWTAKWTIEEAVRKAGFPRWTVLRPVFMMDNFIQPKVQHMFPGLQRGEIASALKADTKLQLISADDVGHFAVAAFAVLARFTGHNIDLAAESLTVAQIAAILSEQLAHPIRVIELSPDEAVANGLFPGWVLSQEWTNVHGYRASIEALATWNISLTSFADWIKARRSQFHFASD